MPKRGLYSNIQAKRKRIKAQKKAGKTPERMRAKGSKGAPTDKAFKQLELENLDGVIDDYEEQLQELYGEIALAKKTRNITLKAELETKKQILDEGLRQAQSKIYEQQKLSGHSVLIKESEFESRLMTLMKLARNSIMYLSLAIHVEEKNKPDDGAVMMPIEVPLK